MNDPLVLNPVMMCHFRGENTLVATAATHTAENRYGSRDAFYLLLVVVL